jgi:hypothetical protein
MTGNVVKVKLGKEDWKVSTKSSSKERALVTARTLRYEPSIILHHGKVKIVKVTKK